jgi:hypothetical protein
MQSTITNPEWPHSILRLPIIRIEATKMKIAVDQRVVLSVELPVQIRVRSSWEACNTSTPFGKISHADHANGELPNWQGQGKGTVATSELPPPAFRTFLL